MPFNSTIIRQRVIANLITHTSVKEISSTISRFEPAVPILLATGVYVLYIFACTLSPFTFTLDPSATSLFKLYSKKFDTALLFWSLPLWDRFSNILLFVPFGFLISTLLKQQQLARLLQLILATGSAATVSFTLESCQLFLPRAPSFVDVLLNMFGGMLGAILSISSRVQLNHIITQCWFYIKHSRRLSWLITIYVINLLIISSLPLMPNFHSWGNADTVLEILAMGIYGKYRWAYLFLLLFPIGFCCYILFLRKWSHTGKVTMLSSLFGITIWGLIEMISVNTTHREFDAFIILVGAGIILLSVLASWILNKTVRIS